MSHIPTLWNVRACTALTPAASSLSCNSRRASRLNVVHRSRSGRTPRRSSSRTRPTSTAVLPLPAGATTCTTPSPASTARRCSASSSASLLRSGVTRSRSLGTAASLRAVRARACTGSQTLGPRTARASSGSGDARSRSPPPSPLEAPDQDVTQQDRQIVEVAERSRREPRWHRLPAPDPATPGPRFPSAVRRAVAARAWSTTSRLSSAKPITS